MVHKVVDGSDKETLTVLFTVNVAGDIPPSMILYWYSRVPFEVSRQIPKGNCHCLIPFIKFFITLNSLRNAFAFLFIQFLIFIFTFHSTTI